MLLRFILAIALVIAVDARASGKADYEVSANPFWRSSDAVSTSELVSRIHEFRDRYRQLPEEHKRWARESYGPEALSQYLFQVNKIEGEGFDTFEETREAILRGKALELGDVIQSDRRLEAVRCLDRALRIFFPDHQENGTVVELLSVPKILEAHQELMASTKPEFAAHLRREMHEVVFTRTLAGGIHVFLWPTRVEAALEELVASSNEELKELIAIDEAEFSAESLEAILNVMPFPNVLLVERSDGNADEPPFVDKRDYYECFARAQEEQKFEMVRSDGAGASRIVVAEENVANARIYPPADLAALVIEGVYVGWKRFFDALGSQSFATF
ncbi:hypothetical protein SELMODRAFT_407185 [Selaginella moellendorffii]|uniref:Uncharacterized protein n=1 Tax=Selaginella moellendorffii TaxID=88036 RepID=D8R465_SELML|nr:hypothetical protein SELMODRAFT_407185 [Selaginella moellendorffii]